MRSYLKRKYIGSGLENWWFRRADHATPIYPQKLALKLADGGSVGIVRLWRRNHAVCLFVYPDGHHRTQNKISILIFQYKVTSDLRTSAEVTPETSCPSNIFQTLESVQHNIGIINQSFSQTFRVPHARWCTINCVRFVFQVRRWKVPVARRPRSC
jgi:hypothetical protein